MEVDLHRQQKFPPVIAVTNSRPDMVLWSIKSRQVVVIELTVPWEEHIEEANERKRSKYQQLVEDYQQNGWKTRCMPVDVGCRGFKLPASPYGKP
jgi:hypothetical protein